MFYKKFFGFFYPLKDGGRRHVLVLGGALWRWAVGCFYIVRGVSFLRLAKFFVQAV